MTASSVRSRVSQGFTLIELLVVIAIIAILAAILFPVFAQARDKARQAACLSNTKQIALGINMYAQDYDETLPIMGDLAQCRGRWQWQIFPYVKNEQVFTCPNVPNNKWSAVTTAATAACGGAAVQLGQSDFGGYGWNAALRGAGNPPDNGFPNASGVSLAAVGKPADTIIVGETGLLSGNARSGYALVPRDPRAYPAAPGTHATNPAYMPQFRHAFSTSRSVSFGGSTASLPLDGQCNFAFMDGHAKAMNIGTAMERGPLVGGVPTEDGTVLENATAPPGEAATPLSRYIRWNAI